MQQNQGVGLSRGLVTLILGVGFPMVASPRLQDMALLAARQYHYPKRLFITTRTAVALLILSLDWPI